jgi:hypothetical protein
MNMNLDLNEKINDIINGQENEILIHKKISSLFSEISSNKFIHEVFENNLNQIDFITKKWKSNEIPQLKIIENEKTSLYYHFFLPELTLNDKNAAYLIHHHGNNVLSSYIFFGPGYQTIEFDKKIIKKIDNSYKLKINKDYFHKNGSSYILDSYTPHLVFNVLKPTASIVLWSSVNSNKQDDLRLNYTFENGKFLGIKETVFLKKIKKSSTYEENSEMQIHSICYFMQQIGYKNNLYINKILTNDNITFFWKKWLTKMINNERIEFPFYNYKINTLENDINIKFIRNLSNKRKDFNFLNNFFK